MVTDIQKIHERQSIIVIDDYLSKSELEKFQKHFYDVAGEIFGNEMEEPSSRQWFDCWDEHDFSDICKDLFLLSSQYFDNSKCIGYEFWVRKNSRPDSWHFDIDEKARKLGKTSYPTCTVIFYPDVSFLNGGRIHIEDTIITPKTNRVIIFSPNVEHFVEEFTGKRSGILVLPREVSLINKEIFIEDCVEDYPED
tara:strand:+ start:80 stop:664 length:585 start_codon:yes stop_codon:yes gene_type:complete